MLVRKVGRKLHPGAVVTHESEHDLGIGVRVCVSDEGEQHELSVERRDGSQVFTASLEPLGFDAVTLTEFGEFGVARLGQIERLEIVRELRAICV